MGMRRSHRQTGFAAAARRRPLFSLAALFAIFLQAFVVQTHVHAPGTLAVVGHQQSGEIARQDSTPHVSAPDDDRGAKALCQVLAAAGAATMPIPATICAADRPTEAAIIALSLAPRVHTHSWQSRAPPSFL